MPGFKAQMRLVRTQDFPTSRLEGARQSLVIVVVRLRFRIEQEADQARQGVFLANHFVLAFSHAG